MIVKNLTISLFSLCFLAGCGRNPEVRTYTEVVQIPESAMPQVQQEPMPSIPEMLRAAPLPAGQDVPENMPADHAGFVGQLPPSMTPPSTPAGDPNAMQGRESEVPPASESGDLAWDLPGGWSSRAGSGLRAAEFIPNGTPPGTVVTLIALGGLGGNADANIARWRGQVGLAPEGESKTQKIDGNLPFLFVTFVEESQAAGKPTTTIAGIYTLENRTLFLKFMGPTDIVAAHKLDFLQLAGSLRLKEPSS